MLAEPVALRIDEVEDVHRRLPHGVAVLVLEARRQRPVEGLDPGAVIVRPQQERGIGGARVASGPWR